MIILKDRDANSVTGNWLAWHQNIGGAYNLYLNTADLRFVAPQLNGSIGTTPSNSVFTLKN